MKLFFILQQHFILFCIYFPSIVKIIFSNIPLTKHYYDSFNSKSQSLQYLFQFQSLFFTQSFFKNIKKALSSILLRGFVFNPFTNPINHIEQLQIFISLDQRTNFVSMVKISIYHNKQNQRQVAMTKQPISNKAKGQSKKKNVQKSADNKAKKKKNQQSLDMSQQKLLEVKRKPKTKLIQKLQLNLTNDFKGHFILDLWRKDLSLLNRNHLPPLVKLLQMEQGQDCYLNPIKGFLSSKKKTFKNEIVVEIPNNKRSALIKSGEFPILLAIQNICFYSIKFSEFLQLFASEQYEYEDLASIFRSLRETVLEQSHNQNIQIDDNQTILWPSALMQTLNFDSNSLFDLMSNFLINCKETNNLLSQIKNKTLNKSMSKSVQNKNILESFKSPSAANIQKIRDNNSYASDLYGQYSQDFSNKQRDKSFVNDPYIQSFIKNNGIMEQQSGKPQISQIAHQSINIEQNYQQSSLPNKGQHPKIDIYYEGRIVETQKKFCVWLIGTSKYIFRKQGLIPWQRVPEQNRTQIFKNTKMSYLIKPVNQVITSLNKFQSLADVNPKYEDFKLFLNRLSYYRPLQNTQLDINKCIACIPLRFENPKEGTKRVLVRNFYYRINQMGKKVQQSSLVWILFEQLVTNYTFPILSREQMTLLYLAKLIPHIQIVTKFFFRKFYFVENQQKSEILTQQKVRRIFREFFPQFLLTKQQVQYQRCFYCYYTIRNMPFECCFFCKKFSHTECCLNLSKSEFKQKNPYQNGISIVNYENQDQNNNKQQFKGSKWVCQTCQPCSLCLQAVGNSHFRCNVCLNYLHIECGKLKCFDQNQNISYSQQYKEKYICKFCLKCCMCNTKLRDQEHMLVQDDFFCSSCYQVIKNNQHCHICRKQNNDIANWTQCECNKWVHNDCDPEFFQKMSKITKDDQRYLCPFCRKKQVRNVLIELIRDISIFDELQYFTQPTYQAIPSYKTMIKNPMCFMKMKQKALLGYYDDSPFQKIKKDFDLIISNAFQFNMPKDSAYFQAKILKILGELAFQSLQQYFKPSIELIINNQIWEQVMKKRKRLHDFINDHYPQILVNYKANKSYIQVKKRPSVPNSSIVTPSLTAQIPSSILSQMGNPKNLTTQPIFHSPLILNNLFKHSTILFHIKKGKVKIQSLFTMPKSQNQIGSWLPLKGQICYFHNDCKDIIFTCPECFQSYCCVRKCYKHRICQCGLKGCGCDDFQCNCPKGIYRDKQKKAIKAKLMPRYSQQKYYRSNRQVELDITQNYKYCWKCANINILERHCVYCDKICSYNYKKCQSLGCNKVWHKSCSNKASSICDYPSYCKICLQQYHKQPLLNTLQQSLMLQTRSKLIKISKIQKYMKIFLDTYRYLGIRLTPPQIQQLILDNYDQFSIRENLFKQYEINFELLRKYKSIKVNGEDQVCIDHSKDIKEELQTYLICQKVKSRSQNQLLRQLGGQIVYKKEYLLSCKSIWWKYFKNVYIFDISVHTNSKLNLYHIQFTERLRVLAQISAANTSQGFNFLTIPSSKYLDSIQKFQKCLYYTIPILQEQKNQDLKNFTQITTIQIRQRLIKNISAPIPHKIYNKYLQLQYQINKCIQKIQAQQVLNGKLSIKYIKNPINEPQIIPLPNDKQIIKFVHDENPILFYNYVSTFLESYLFGKIKSQLNPIFRPRPIPHKYHYNPIIKKKDEVNQKVTSFLEAIYQRSKCALRKGNTSILKGSTTNTLNNGNGQQNRIWVVLKRWGKHIINKQNQIELEQKSEFCIDELVKKKKELFHPCFFGMKQFIIKLQKVANIWTLEIKNCCQLNSPDNLHAPQKFSSTKSFIVSQIQDIINNLNKQMDANISSFKELGQFLGFTIYQPFYKANHFTHFLQTNIVDEMPFQTRIKKVQQVYDNFIWGRDGFHYKECKVSDLNQQQSGVAAYSSGGQFQGKDSLMRVQYNMTKVKPYYLSKRKTNKNKTTKTSRDGFVTIKQNKQDRQPPFITFEDLKKHIQPSTAPITVQQKNQISINLKNQSIPNEVFIAPSKIHKLGLFSKKKVKKGTVVIQYKGQVISQSVADLREEQYHYGCYMFGINKQQISNAQKKDIIDATFKGNMARYLNHSCDPNCKAKTQNINGSPRIFIYTIKDIPEYEQLTYDYQFNVDTNEKLQCTCGAKNCQGRLN